MRSPHLLRRARLVGALGPSRRTAQSLRGLPELPGPADVHPTGTALMQAGADARSAQVPMPADATATFAQPGLVPASDGEHVPR